MHRGRRAQQFVKKSGYLQKQPVSGDRKVATHSFSTPRPGGVWKTSRENDNSSTRALDNFASDSGCGFFWGWFRGTLTR